MPIKILFFTTALEHTTYRKTAKMLQKEGASIRLIGFTRNNFPISEMDSLSTRNLGVISHGNYFSRIFRLLNLLLILRKEAKDYPVIYNFTIDTLLISKLSLSFKKKMWIYQIQDIRPIYFGNSLKSRIMRALEKWLMRHVDFVVVSSKNYYENYFQPLYGLDKSKIEIIENKLIFGSISPSFLERSSENKKITIGYFGVLRCERSWQILKHAATTNEKKLNVFLRGKPIAIPNLENQIEDSNNIRYEGPYKSPDDLNELYNQVDVVWAAYPYNKSKDGNWKYARTIRFYEALAFKKPVIVQKGTPQAKDVEENGIGLVVDMANIEETTQTILKIDQKQLDSWRDNINILPKKYYYHSNEYKHFMKRIENKFNSR